MLERKACLDLSLAMVIVGSSVAAGAHVIAHLPMHFAMAVRFVAACSLLVPWCIAREGRLPQLSLQQWGLVFVQAVCGVFLFNVLLLEGLKHTDPGSAGIVVSCTPATMAMLAWLLLRELPSRRTWFGVGLCVAGLLSLHAWDTAAADRGASLYGMLLVVGAVVSESMFLLLRKLLPISLSPLAASTAVSLAGLAQFLPLGIWQAQDVDIAAVAPATWLVLVYYGLGISAAAYLLWFRGVVRVPGAVAAVFTGILPVSGLTVSAIFLGLAVTWAHVLGCALVLGAIALLSGLGRGFSPRRLRAALGLR